MGIATYPAVTSPVKSIQRGSASGAGNITITAVDTTKTMVNSFATSFSGAVAASGSINAANGNNAAHSTGTATMNIGPFALASVQRYVTNFTNTTNTGTLNAMNINAAGITLNSTSLTGGTTNLAASGIFLVNSTTITATGACRYEVIEYF